MRLTACLVALALAGCFTPEPEKGAGSDSDGGGGGAGGAGGGGAPDAGIAPSDAQADARPGDAGICVPAGDPCLPGDCCAGGATCSAADGLLRCLARCEDGACPPGEACVGDPAVCVPDDACSAGGCPPEDVCVVEAARSRCDAAGDAAVGADCQLGAAADARCQAGLLCLTGRCVPPCGPACAACATVEGVEICADTCDVFSQTGCGAGEACLAWRLGVADAASRLVGLCAPAPGTTGQPGDACVGVGAAYHGDCAPTSTCALAVRTPAVDRRCMPLCDDGHPCPGAGACERLEVPGLPLGQTATCRGDCRVFDENPCEDGQFCRAAAVGLAGNALTLVGWCTPLEAADWGPVDAPCSGPALPSDCGPGLACDDARCRPLCALDGPCVGGGACAPLPGLPAYGTCAD